MKAKTHISDNRLEKYITGKLKESEMDDIEEILALGYYGA